MTSLHERIVVPLSREQGVDIVLDPEWGGIGAAGEHWDGHPFIVLTKKGEDETSLLTALHELGHHATRWGVRGGDNWNNSLRLDMEVAAWEWALSQLGHPPSPAGYRYIQEGLGAYILDKRYRTTQRATAFYAALTDQLIRMDENGGFS